MPTEPFDPWSAAERHADLIVAVHPVAQLMGGGFHARRGALNVIVVDPDLSGPDRRAVLTHELVHHERGGSVEQRGAPAGLAGLVAREERLVDREVARRLVPPAELLALIDERTRAGGSVDADLVAEQFEVPPVVAARALDDLVAHPPVLPRE